MKPVPPQLSEPAFFEKLCPIPLKGGFRLPQDWVWCGSAIEGEDGRYHLFASRWSQSYPMFSGYVLHSEIVRAVSDTPEGPYTFVEKVLPCSSLDSWDARMAHNPTIRKHGDDYLLYYIGSNYQPDDKEDADTESMCTESYKNIRIGLATSKSINGPWQVREKPILDINPGSWDSTVVTNPAPVILPDGKVLLYYRSNTPKGLRIGLAEADHYEGPYQRVGTKPILDFPDGNYVEDPFVWWVGDHFEMLAKDMLGGLTGELYAGVHLKSMDGRNWEMMDSPTAYSRKIVYEDGTTQHLGALERPQLLFNQLNEPIYLFAAAADGPGGFRQASKTWNIAIPLKTDFEPPFYPADSPDNHA